PFPALCLVAVTGIPDLAAMVGALGVVTSADGSIAADLQTGSISIDVARILTTAGLDLHSLPANTDLVPLITGALASQLLPAVSSALTGLIDQVTSSIGSIAITVASIPLPLGAVTALLAPLLTSVTAPIFTSISGLGASVVSPLGGALTQVLSLEANVQDTVAGVFTERALRVGLLPAASPAAAVVDLASASVGPNNGPAAVVAPTATGLTPDHGPAGGGTSVTVSGSAFVSGQTSVTIGGLTVPASGVTVNGAGTSLTFVTPAHPAGPVSVTATTPAGTTAPLAYTYDPGGNGGIPAPVITTPVDGSTVATATPPIGGTGVAGDTVTVSEGGVTVCSALVGLNSTWSCVPGAPLASGNHTVIATQAAPAAASSGPSNAVTFTVVLPASVPTVSGVHPSHGPAAGHTTVTVTGAAFVVGQTSITIGGIAVPASAVTVNAAGTSLTFATPSHEPGPVDVTTTTPAGTSRPQAYTYDPVPPPVITSPADGSTVATPTPPIEGTGTAGDIVTVTENGNVVCTATAGSNGRWQCTPAAPLDNGKHTIVATQTDVAGHVSDPSSTVTFTVSSIVAVARPGLPNTGTNVVGPLVVGGVLLASGIALLVAMGRRRAG
ncbi:MAG: Cable pili-associated 22 kDa adhesin protein, partial [Pseudonocardiales bacterium]|nr:Cable pili-associated 22 kDa adhesin protein [Pseudonocardiales bacterium]